VEFPFFDRRGRQPRDFSSAVPVFDAGLMIGGVRGSATERIARLRGIGSQRYGGEGVPAGKVSRICPGQPSTGCRI